MPTVLSTPRVPRARRDAHPRSSIFACTPRLGNACPVATTLPRPAFGVAVATVVLIHQNVDEASGCFILGTIEAEDTTFHYAGSVFAGRNGVRQPTRIAARRRAAVGFFALQHAFASAQLATGAAALVNVGGIDDQRATQCAEPSRGDHGSSERASSHQNCPRQSSESP